MTSPTKILSEEHQHILTVIKYLNQEVDALDSGKEIDTEFFKAVIDFIRNYADKFHHAKEEDILFVEFNKKADQAHCNPVEQMLHEHDLGRQFVKNLEIGVNEKDKSKVIENARGYAGLLQEHISKEDNILYPMMDEVFDQQVQDSISNEFKKVNQVKIEEKEKYLNLVKKLENGEFIMEDKKEKNDSNKTTSSTKNFNLHQLTSYSSGGILSKVIQKTEKQNITLFSMAAGTSIGEHTSTKEGFVYIIEGEGVFNLECEEIEMKAGVYIHMDSNAKHSLQAKENTSFLLSLVN
tara:strand:+ start:1362 stop:2243 length:882 start_codon:yes stop_codon:yes gene_type:complete